MFNYGRESQERRFKERSITQVSMGAVMVVCTLIRKISLIPHQVITYDVYISDK
jgi:hypothetical protein